MEDAGAGLTAGLGGWDGGFRLVAVRVRAVRVTAGGEVAQRPVLAVFAVRGGVVTAMEGRHER